MLFTLISEIANKLFPLIVLSYVARVLGVEAFGYAQYGMYLIDLGMPFVLLGLMNWGAIRIAKYADEPQKQLNTIVNIAAIKLINALIVFVVFVLFINSSSAHSEYRSIYYILSFAFITTVLDCNYFLTGTKKIPVLSIFSLVSKFLSLIAIFIFVDDSSKAIEYAVITVGANALISLSTFSYAIRKVWLAGAKFRLEGLIDDFKATVHFSLTIILMSILARYDLFLAELSMGTLGAGLYGSAQKLYISILSLISGVYLVFYSESADENNEEGFLHKIRLSLFIMLTIAAPAAIGALFVGQDLIQLVVGNEFVSAFPVFITLAFTLIPQAAIHTLGLKYLTIKKKQKVLNTMILISAIFGISLSSFLANTNGLLGVAEGFLLSHAFLAVLLLAYVVKLTRTYIILLPIFQVGLPTCIMALILWILDLSFIGNILVGFISFASVFVLVNKNYMSSFYRAKV